MIPYPVKVLRVWNDREGLWIPCNRMYTKQGNALNVLPAGFA
jgi:hypothetical protein